jgi:hypothetical protein
MCIPIGLCGQRMCAWCSSRMCAVYGYSMLRLEEFTSQRTNITRYYSS